MSSKIFFSKKIRKKIKNRFDIRIFRCIVLSGIQEQSVLEQKTVNLSSIGDTTKKTINKTFAIGAAFTAAVILAPATFARDHHEPPANGIRLAADIVNLVRAVFEPRPAPVIVKAPPTVVEKTVVLETVPTVVAAAQEVVTAAPGTVIVTGAEEIDIPEYNYVLYEEEFIPYYEGWLFYRDEWRWVGVDPRPIAPPRWTPPPRHRDHRPHKIIVLPDRHRGHAPLPLAHRHEDPRRAPAPVIVRREEPRHAPAPAARHEEPCREPARTTAVRQEKQKQTVVRPEKDKKEAKRAEPQKKGAPPAKKR